MRTTLLSLDNWWKFYHPPSDPQQMLWVYGDFILTRKDGVKEMIFFDSGKVAYQGPITMKDWGLFDISRAERVPFDLSTESETYSYLRNCPDEHTPSRKLAFLSLGVILLGVVALRKIQTSQY